MLTGPPPKFHGTRDILRGDIAEQEVDAIVNPANTAMRGGGGADGAIHRAGGPAILRDCVKRFPDGLATGDAGWTTAGDLPAQWVIHTVGPNYNTGQRDRSILESCYRRALEVADELGARIIAFPLIGTGAFGWPRQDAIAAAIETVATVNTRVEEVRLVAFDSEIHEQVLMHLASSTPIRILQGVQVLHQRGYHRLRILPGVSPSGMYWRVAITVSDNLIDDVDYPHVVNLDTALLYSTGGLTEFAGGEVTVTTTPELVADLILNELPEAAPTNDDPRMLLGSLTSCVLSSSPWRHPWRTPTTSTPARDGRSAGAPASGIRDHPSRPSSHEEDTL